MGFKWSKLGNHLIFGCLWIWLTWTWAAQLKKNSWVSKIWKKIEKFHFIVKESLCDSFGDFGDWNWVPSEKSSFPAKIVKSSFPAKTVKSSFPFKTVKSSFPAKNRKIEFFRQNRKIVFYQNRKIEFSCQNRKNRVSRQNHKIEFSRQIRKTEFSRQIRRNQVFPPKP